MDFDHVATNMNRRNLLIIGLLLLLLLPPGGPVLRIACVQGQSQEYRGKGPKADPETAQTLKERFSREFDPSEKSTGLPYYLTAFVILGLLVAGLVYGDRKYRQFQKDGYENPAMLFRELCAAHQLTKLERGLLKDIAQELDLEDALPLFIDPKFFFSALEEPRFAESRKAIKYLLGKFFDIHSETDPRSTEWSGVQRGEVGGATTMIYPPSHGVFRRD